ITDCPLSYQSSPSVERARLSVSGDSDIRLKPDIAIADHTIGQHEGVGWMPAGASCAMQKSNWLCAGNVITDFLSVGTTNVESFIIEPFQKLYSVTGQQGHRH